MSNDIENMPSIIQDAWLTEHRRFIVDQNVASKQSPYRTYEYCVYKDREYITKVNTEEAARNIVNLSCAKAVQLKLETIFNITPKEKQISAYHLRSNVRS